MGHHAVAVFDGQVQRPVGCARVGQHRQHGGHAHGAFVQPPDGQEPPAHEAVHVFVDQPRNPRQLAQQGRQRPGGIVARLRAAGHAAGGLVQIGQRRPGIGGKPVAHPPCRADGGRQRIEQPLRDRLARVHPLQREQRGRGIQQRAGGAAAFGQPDVGGAQEPHHAFGAFDIAAQPEQVVGRARRQRAGAAAAHRLARHRRQRGARHRAGADDPDIRRAAAALHGDGLRIGAGADAGEPAGHRHPSRPRARQKHPQRHRARHRAAIYQRGRGGQGHRLLRHKPGAVLGQPGSQRRRAKVARAPLCGLGCVERHPRGQRGRQDQPVRRGLHRRRRRRIAAPPRGDVGHQQGRPHQIGRQLGQERHQRPGFQHARPQRIHHRQPARPQGRHQPRRAQARGMVQLHRVGIAAVQAPPQHLDRAQARHGAHHQAPGLHGQILALHQGDAQVTRQPGMFEIGLVQRPRRQDGNAGVTILALGQQRIAEGAKEPGQAVDVFIGIKPGKGARGGDPVFQRIACTRRRLRAVGQHPPVAIGAAAQLEGQEMQVMPRPRRDPHHGPQPFGVARHQRRRQAPGFDQPARAVKIGHHRFQQVGALHQRGRQAVPVVLPDQNRQMAQRPGPFGGPAAAILAIEHAAVGHVLIRPRHAQRQLVGRQPVQMPRQPSPKRAQGAVRGHRLVRHAGQGGVARQERAAVRGRGVGHGVRPPGPGAGPASAGIRGECVPAAPADGGRAGGRRAGTGPAAVPRPRSR